jgi:hypothetical protein
MPYEKVSVGHGKYNVVNKDTGEVHARGTTSGKADAQMRLLRGVEHGMKPRTTTEAAGLKAESKTHAKAHKKGKK